MYFQLITFFEEIPPSWLIRSYFFLQFYILVYVYELSTFLTVFWVTNSNKPQTPPHINGYLRHKSRHQNNFDIFTYRDMERKKWLNTFYIKYKLHAENIRVVPFPSNLNSSVKHASNIKARSANFASSGEHCIPKSNTETDFAHISLFNITIIY